MTAVLASDCVGLWRRTLLIEADGSTDTGTDVTWLQGITAYVDNRGFAGTLAQRGNIFEWHRTVDLEPPGPFPDAGSMTWRDDGVLVETGVHSNYVEHWVRDDAPDTPCGAAFLATPDGRQGLLVRVGALYGWAGGGTVEIDSVDGPAWNAMDITSTHIQANGVRWTVVNNEGSLNL